MNGKSQNLYEILRSKLSVVIISTLILGGGLFGQVYADIPAIERATLIALYNSTNGDNWSDNSGWNGALGTECSWYGVTCTGDSVTQLSLISNQLTGSIPAELGNLTNLQRLNLSTNQLTGSIPVELMNMTSLDFLDICDNHLYTSDPDLRDFLDSRQPGWESCQTPPFGTGIPANPGIPILLLGE